MEAPQAPAVEAKPKTKKVRMPDGEIRIKVQQADGSWRWQKTETEKKTASASVSTAPITSSPESAAQFVPTKAPAAKPATTKAPAAGRASTFPIDKTTKKAAPTKKKPTTVRNFGRLFQAAKVLDAVLPEHLKLADDIAEDLGFDVSDNDSGSKGGHPTAASSKALAKVAAGGMKTKSKKAKRSVYRPGETGSSDESDLDEKSPTQSSDTIKSVKETTTGISSKAFDEKTGLEINEKEITPVKKRPSKGRRLQRRSSRLAQGVSWSIALFFPLFFLILAMLNASLDGKSAVQEKIYGETTLGTRLKQVNKICVSMWPILFGAIVAQSFKMYAAWKVERGIKLITLEQLIGSHSLATAIKQPFFLQTINWTAIGMICLWALSPLAGQSFLRMLTLADHMSNSTLTNITYPDFSQPLTYAFTESYLAENQTSIDLMFATAMLSSAGQFPDGSSVPNDAWQNPNILLYPLNYSHTFPGDVPWTVVGVPIINWPGTDYERTYSNLTFFTNYSYFDMRCEPPYNATIAQLNAQLPSPLRSNTAGDTWMASYPPATNESSSEASLYYASNNTAADSNTTTTNVTVWSCRYYTQYITVNSTCWYGGESCRAAFDQFLPNSTDILLPEPFIDAFLNTPVLQGPLGSDYRPLWDWTLDTTDDSSAVLTYQNALITLINAYWQIGFTFPILSSTHANPNQYYVRNMANVTAAIFIEGTPSYEVGWLWFSIVVIACVLLIVFGVTSIILDTRTMGPDIIGFASSLTRDNRYIKLAEEDIEHIGGREDEVTASSKNAYESLRDMKHHTVMLQDVRGHEDVGKIALGSVGVKNGKPLQRDRLYR